MPVEPIPCAPGGDGTPVEVTTCCAPSIAGVPLCRDDGTTVLLVVRSGCVECGQPAEDPAVVGWISTANGTFVAGPAPADAAPCEAGCVDTVCRQLCDDTDGDGEADTTYSELWCVRADGSAELVLTYRDDPSQPYAPIAPVECTYGCPEAETVTLCDDGGPFLRRYTWLQGVATFEDFALDGQTPHVVTGTVGVCDTTEPCEAQTTPAATLGLCLPDGTPLAVLITRDCDGTTTQDGWLNLLTGTYTSGPPPVGAAACGDARAFELAGVLCDTDPATGDVLGLVLVEYAYAADGSLASVRLVDAATGATYTLQGELRRCPSDGSVAQPEQDLTVLCDVQADGTSTAFVRDYRRDPATGQVTGHTDYTLDGQPYAPAGTVSTCAPAAEPCRNTSTVLLCDLPTGGNPDAVVTNVDPAPYYPYPTGLAVTGAQALWDGGTLDLPPGTGPQPGTTGTVNSLAATVQAPRPTCDTGTARVAVSLTVQQTGPDDGCGQVGHLRLFVGTTQTALTVLPANAPAGWFGTLTVEADVPAADLAAGDVAVALALDAYDDNPTGCAPSPRRTGWQLSALTTTVAYDQTGCAAQILRTVLTDCDTGTVLSVADTTLDGQPYTVTGEVGQCTTAGGGECCPAPEPEPCRNSSTLLVCDLPGDGEPTPTVTDTSPAPYDAGTPGTDPVTGGAAALWSGGVLTIPPDTTPAADGHVQRLRSFASTVQAPRPGCDTGTALVTASVRVERDGPDAGCFGTGLFSLVAGGAPVSTVGVNPSSIPVGTVSVLTVSASVPAADLAAGTVALVGRLETYHLALGSCPGTGPGGARIGGWTVDDFTVSVAYNQAGCAEQVFANVVTDCETGAVESVSYTLPDGTPYTPKGTIGQCESSGSACCPEPPCPARSVIEQCRCDDADGDGIADTDYVELLGVDCTGAVTSLGAYLPDLSVPYTPVAPIPCDDTGAPSATGVQARRVELAAGASWDAAAWPRLQSVTAVAHGGTGTVTTADGTSTLHQGETAAWSIARDEDAALTGPLTIAAGSGTVTVSFTIGVTL